jgi:protein LTV1
MRILSTATGRTEVVEVSGDSDEEWDCQSIISTYTNTENHPSLISVKRIELDKRGTPITAQEREKKRKAAAVAQARENLIKKEYASFHSFFLFLSFSSVNLGKVRSKEETKEEKKARKAALKEERKGKRAQKKTQKVAFKKEEVRIQKTVAGQVTQAQTSVYY